MADFYKTLGVAKDASQSAIKKAYRQLAKEHHPDKHKGDAGQEDKFKRITEAYNTLSDPDLRAEYDAANHAPPRTPPPPQQNGFYADFLRRKQANSRQNFNPFIDPRRPPPDPGGGHPLFAGGGRSGRRARRRAQAYAHAQTPNHQHPASGGCPACGGSRVVKSVRNGRVESDRCPLCG